MQLVENEILGVHDGENSYRRLLSLKHRPEYPEDDGSPAIKLFPALILPLQVQLECLAAAKYVICYC
jgi:hypothetical protein